MRNSSEKKICIICEGFEEIDYLNALINKAVFSNKYEFILVNSKSINNICSIYQIRYQSNTYDLVLVFCDTDKLPSIRYKEIKNEINEFHGKTVADDIVIFGNPCTMQIVISHFAKIKLTSQSKTVNSKYIEQYVGIKNYKATDEQRKELFSRIKRDNYEKMKENISKLSTDDDVTSSTNMLKFLKMFESNDTMWIDTINKNL